MKAGDNVECISKDFNPPHITFGKLYEVLEVDVSFGGIYILDDSGKREFYYINRFKVIPSKESLHDKIDEAISLVGKTVTREKDIFTVTHWGAGNKYSRGDVLTENLDEDGVCVYVGSENFIAPLNKVKVIENFVKINSEYFAVIHGDNIEVGRQSIPIDKVKEIVAMYDRIKK